MLTKKKVFSQKENHAEKLFKEMTILFLTNSRAFICFHVIKSRKLYKLQKRGVMFSVEIPLKVL